MNEYSVEGKYGSIRATSDMGPAGTSRANREEILLESFGGREKGGAKKRDLSER